MKFESEVALCAAFIEAIDKRVWVAYAETAGWDILLSRRLDGLQIGIQAKLALNVDVINQAIESSPRWSAAAEGPDCRAVLVPYGTNTKLSLVCEYIGLLVIRVDPDRSRGSYRSYVTPDLPDKRDAWRSAGDWHEWAPTKRHKLPEFVPDVAAGSSAPIQLTEWKIKAIKIAVILEMTGLVRRSDFAHLQIDHRRWIGNEWLVLSDKRDGYVAGKAIPKFKKQHPKVFAEIAAKFETWKPPGGLL